MDNKRCRFGINGVIDMVAKSKISYLHFIKKTDEGYYWCDWYRYGDGRFYTFWDGMKVCFVKEEDGLKTVRPLHIVKIDPDKCNWYKANGVLELDDSRGKGFSALRGITDISKCVNEMLGGENGN